MDAIDAIFVVDSLIDLIILEECFDEHYNLKSGLFLPDILSEPKNSIVSDSQGSLK